LVLFCQARAIKLTPDGRRLLLVIWLSEGSNFWAHSNGTYSYVPTEQEIETLTIAHEAINNYNKEQVFKRNIKD
jgi:hypothetical protein